MVGMASHDQSTQNNKFAKCLQYLKKEARDEILVQINMKIFY